MELEVSSLWPARRRLWIDGRWSLGSEQWTPLAAPRATEQPFFRDRTAHLTRGGT